MVKVLTIKPRGIKNWKPERVKGNFGNKHNVIKLRERGTGL